MQLVTTLAVVLGAALFIGCSDPLTTDPANAVSDARLRKVNWPLPDSIRIPPSPVPPIYDEVVLVMP